MDDLTNPQNRILVFEEDDFKPKQTIMVGFPSNRGTLIYKEKLYDWYGREVEINPRIKRIVRPFGYSISKIHDIMNYRDNFIVELQNGKFAVVGLYYHYPEPNDPAYTGSRCMATGHILDATPYLKFDDSIITYETIDDEPLKSTCLSDLQFDNEYPLAAIGQLSNSDQCVFLSSNVHHCTSSNGFFVHHVVPSKAALLEFFDNPEKSKKASHPPSIFSQTTLCGSIIYHEDGNKITADFSYTHPKLLKASLDRDCLKYRRANHLYWYEDNNP